MSDNIQKTPQKTPMDIMNTAFARKKAATGQPSEDGYEHPNAESILSGARKILEFTASGQDLLKFMEEKDIEIKVLKDNKTSGYIPSAEIGVIACPATQKKTYPSTVLNLISVIREAQQEDMGFARPSPHLSEDEYVKKDLEKQEDIYVIQFHTAYQLWKNSSISDLIDAMKKEWDPEAIDAFINYMETNSG